MTVSLTPIHPVYAAAFKANQAAPAFGTISYAEYRAMANTRLHGIKLPEVIEEDRTVTMEDGRSLTVTLLRPLGTEHEMIPGVVFYFGGGWVSGSKHTHGKLIRDICVKARVAVVFPEHSLAPDVKFPVIHEECYSTLQWVVANGKDAQIDVSKLAVCGDSAGGNVAAVVCQMAKERGMAADAIKAQILLYPSTSPCGRGKEMASFDEFGGGAYELTADEVYAMEHAYNDNRVEAKLSTHMSPILASVEALRGLPAALVVTAEADVLRDEAEAYARKLTAAGVRTAAVRVIGATHGFMNVPVETELYRRALGLVRGQLDEAFGRGEE